MNVKTLFCVACAVCFACLPATSQAQTRETDLKETHLAVLKNWLKSKPTWRLALENDYDKEALDYLRGSEDKNILPFYAAKDFNGDRIEDFAVILVTKTGAKRYAAAVFNAPLNIKKTQQPAFYSSQIESGDILYYNKNSKRLLVGPYASDAGFALEPSGKGYKVKTFDPPDE